MGCVRTPADMGHTSSTPADMGHTSCAAILYFPLWGTQQSWSYVANLEPPHPGNPDTAGVV